MGVNTGISVAAGLPMAGGGMSFAPLGTALPTDAETALAAAYKKLGPISREGVRPTRTSNLEKVLEWDGSTLASLVSEVGRAFEVTLYGLYDTEVNQYLFGANAVVTPATVSSGKKVAISDKGGKPDDSVLVFDMRHGKGRHRAILPVASAVITAENPWVGTGLKAYTIAVEALKDASGVRVYEYLDDGTFLAV